MNLFAATRQRIIEPTFDAWRNTARALLQKRIPPEEVSLIDSTTAVTPSLFPPPAEAAASLVSIPIRVPAAFVERARLVACHHDPERWNLLYRILWRLQRERALLRIEIDPDIAQLRRLEQQVKHDLHKMHAFLRFRKIEDNDGEHYIAWYEPTHFILALAAPFFAARFSVMRWSILTPHGSVHWDPATRELLHGPAVPRASAPQSDDLEDLWKTYYRSIFNPARTNLTAMRSEMPTRYWKNLPEIAALPQLLAEAGTRVQSMIDSRPGLTAASFVPAEHTLPVLQQAIPSCRGCALHECATQPVFGRGPLRPRLMLIGEQPGDEEDRRGQPFLGPAGQLLDEILREAPIDRGTVYVTNAVKHFKFTLRGKRRLHESPRLSEIVACRPWLLAELDAVQPHLVVCLGASAAKSLLSAKFALMRERGQLVSSPYAQRIVATIHPSAILRAADPARAAELRALLLADLRLAATLAA